MKRAVTDSSTIYSARVDVSQAGSLGSKDAIFCTVMGKTTTLSLNLAYNHEKVENFGLVFTTFRNNC